MSVPVKLHIECDTCGAPLTAYALDDTIYVEPCAACTAAAIQAAEPEEGAEG